MAEVGTIDRTYHINLVRLYGFCYDQFMGALVYEYLENGSLDKYLFSEEEAREFEWEKLHDVVIGTAKGIAYLHEECVQRIIHYDIKRRNILLDANFFPKVADFGLAKLYNRDNSCLQFSGYKGTPGYMAPEIFQQNHPITRKCDIYSFGMLLFEIVGVGTMGPGPAPLASQPSPRTLKGSGPGASRPRNVWSILRPGTPRGLGPKASRPRNSGSILRPGVRVSHIPDGF